MPENRMSNGKEPDGLEMFHPIVAEWFRTRIGTPSPPQRMAWPEIMAGRSVLVTAPTGAGKTLAAFLEAVDSLLRAGLEGSLPEGVHVLYVSPLKALNNDINRNLDRPLEEIRRMCEDRGLPFPDIRKAVRTGDTSQTERQAMLRKPPHILITTPESLFLLLTSVKASTLLKNVRYLILDEIHAVLSEKRGAHLSLSVERVADMAAPGLVRVGLSATVHPPEVASLFLGGCDAQGHPHPVTLVSPPLGKLKDLRIEMPVQDFRSLEAGSVWPEVYDTVLRLVKAHTATIVFVNNRATAEKITSNVNDLAGEEVCVPHHGSLSKERRQQIEHRFKSGDIRCMVATATLELGIDVGQVDLMIQISAPISITGGLQRLGRAGHRLDAISRGRIIPKTRGDLLKSFFVAQEMVAGRIESARLPREPLDVMAQHLVSMACTGRWTETRLLEVIRHAASYRGVRLSDMRRVLAMLAGDFEHREDIPAKPRLVWDRVNGFVEGTAYSRMLAISAGGTIPDRGMFPVVLKDGHTRIGELDEEYVFESRPGDVFMLGNAPWRMETIDRNRVVVAPAASTHGAETPFWKGDGLGMPLAQGRQYGRVLAWMEERLLAGTLVPDLMDTGLVEESGAVNLQQYLSDQRESTGVLPTDRRIVMETVADGDAGVTILLHALFGGRVNATLETLLHSAIEEELHLAVHTMHTDELILLYLYGVPDEVPSLFPLLAAEAVERTLLRILPSTSRFSIAFRHNAYRALMMGTRKHGTRLPLWVQRLRSVEALDQAVRQADHPLLIETMRECMEDAFDLRGTEAVLHEVSQGSMEVVPVVSWYPSPFASEVMFRFESELLYASAAPHPDRFRHPVVSGMDTLHLEKREQERPPLDPEAVRAVTEENLLSTRFLSAGSMNEVHSLLLMHGDLAELDLPESPEAKVVLEHLLCLQNQGRALKTEIPGPRWIAREEFDLYAAAEPSAWAGSCSVLLAAEAGENGTGLWSREEAALRIVRRYARYAGPFSDMQVENRYAITQKDLAPILFRLEAENFLVRGTFTDKGTEQWCHRILWERMRLRGLRNQSMAVRSRPAAEYAAWLPGHQHVGAVTPATAVGSDLPVKPSERLLAVSGKPSERLFAVLRQFSGVPFPAEWWEAILLPARIPGYQPGLLDRLCASGRVCWRMAPDAAGKALSLSFHDTEGIPAGPAVTMETSFPENLPQEEMVVLSVLRSRGACFTHQLTSATGFPVTTVMQALYGLVSAGFVANDSFAPVRFFLLWNKARDPSTFARRVAMMTARMDMGRWELVTPFVQPDEEKRIDGWFARWGMASHEVADTEGNLSWGDAYERLKRREFSGKVQRGLFFEGLSGIQFVPGDRVPAAPASPVWHVLAACDPAIAYGHILPHQASVLDFTRLPGTAVVLRDGIPVLVAERVGGRIRTFVDDSGRADALRCLMAAFHEKRMWPAERKLVVHPENDAMRALLQTLGFEAEPGRMVLRR